MAATVPDPSTRLTPQQLRLSERPNTYAELDDQAKFEVRLVADDFGIKSVSGIDIP